MCKFEGWNLFLKQNYSDFSSLHKTTKGKNHLASTRIIGSQAYPKTKPRIYNYDTARVGREVNVMSHYKSNRTQAKADVDEGKQERNQRRLNKLEKQKATHQQKTEPIQTQPQPQEPQSAQEPQLAEECQDWFEYWKHTNTIKMSITIRAQKHRSSHTQPHSPQAY